MELFNTVVIFRRSSQNHDVSPTEGGDLIVKNSRFITKASTENPIMDSGIPQKALSLMRTIMIF